MVFFKFVDKICGQQKKQIKIIVAKSSDKQKNEAQTLMFEPQKLVGVRRFELRASWSRTRRKPSLIAEYR